MVLVWSGWPHRAVEPAVLNSRRFAARKRQLVIYLIGGFEERHGSLLQRLGPHKTGKGCLYLKRLDDVDIDVLRRLVRRSIDVRRGVDRAFAQA